MSLRNRTTFTNIIREKNYTNLSCNKSLKVVRVGSLPVIQPGSAGDIVYNITDGEFYGCDGSAWTSLTSSGGGASTGITSSYVDTALDISSNPSNYTLTAEEFSPDAILSTAGVQAFQPLYLPPAADILDANSTITTAGQGFYVSIHNQTANTFFLSSKSGTSVIYGGTISGGDFAIFRAVYQGGTSFSVYQVA